MSGSCGCRSGNGQPCDCCAGVGRGRVASIWNASGLPALAYRIGAHAEFFEAMVARLSSADFPALASLKTRERSDPAIALLDAWATVADVLTFYQERIANEGYLRTATERRSVLELARLIGYELRPGVAATTYLAYTLDKDSAPVVIEPGSRASSVPGPGEQMQTFETADPLEARVEWNRLLPRRTEPQTAQSIAEHGLYLKGTSLNLKPNDPLLIDLANGAGPQVFRVEKLDVENEPSRTRVVLRWPAALKQTAVVNRIAARFSNVELFGVSPGAATTKRVLELLAGASKHAPGDASALKAHLETVIVPGLERELALARERRFTKLEPWIDEALGEMRRAAATLPAQPGATLTGGPIAPEAALLGEAIHKLKQPPSIPPASPRQLGRGTGAAFSSKADTLPRMLAALQPALKKTLYTVYRSVPPASSAIAVYALRVSAAPFGHNAPPRLTDVTERMPKFGEWNIQDPLNTGSLTSDGVGDHGTVSIVLHHTPRVLFLDGDYTVAPDSFVVIERPDGRQIIVRDVQPLSRSLAGYGLSGKTLQLTLPEAERWLRDDDTFSVVRDTRVFAGSEKLDLADVPIASSIGGAQVELEQLYEDLEPGRWLILTGERSDLLGAGGQPIRGVKTGELLMLAAVEQRRRRTAGGQDVAEDSNHTFITFAQPLSYKYAPETVTIYGNVVRATHGETVHEVLGSGDASTALQRFALKRAPLTYVPAPTPNGIVSTLQVRVSDVRWHEARSVSSLSPTDRAFVTKTDDDAKTTVVFGDGAHGARVPTGTENVKATYRAGIGRGGNVTAGQISLLTTRQLGMKDVVNPLRASGGADREDRDEARSNAPLAVAALDRLVSTRDYADFARVFAGIGKASATRLSDGRRRIVQVTVAGADDIPIEPSSDLFRNLNAALHRFGDPNLPIQLAVRERLALVMSANVRVAPDYAWESLEPRIRAALVRQFGFTRAALGRDLLLAHAIAAVQRVPGVAYVDVDVFDATSEAQLLARFTSTAAAGLGRRERVTVERSRVERGTLRPAQLAYLTPEVPDTLILQEIKA